MRKSLLFILVVSLLAAAFGCSKPAENAEPAAEGGRADRTTNSERN